MKAVITGFQINDKRPHNTSYEVMKVLEKQAGKVEIIPEAMIVSYRNTIPYIDSLIQKYKPDVFILMGQALRRELISLEKVAINFQNDDYYFKPDDDGFLPSHATIVEGAPDAYFTNLPIVKMLQALQEAEFPSEISLTAGAVGCNNGMYSLLHLINTKYPSLLGGFIHVPGHHEHPGRKYKTYSVDYIARGIETALAVLGEE